MIDDLEDFTEIPPPPPSEFDRDAECALAAPGLPQEERARIIGEARSLAASGLAREALGNWICREVARTVGGRSGFDAVGPDGNVIEPPEVAAIVKRLKREAGKNRQVKRNAALEQWKQRFWELVDAGQPEEEVRSNCWIASIGHHQRAENKPTYIPPEFEGLPPIYGRDGKSRPKNKKRFLAHFVRRQAH